MNDNLIIIRVDGGIASQISFIALGKAFETKGYKVKYDITWFETEGKGFYNISKGYDKDYDICFDIPKAFPELSIEIADTAEVKHYASRYFADDDQIILQSPPLYIGGYSGRHYDVYFGSLFAKYFAPQEIYQTNTAFYSLLQEILNNQACGIHIRRGDLSHKHVVYGEPTSLTYFRKVIELVRQIEPQSIFYLFSDDIAWTQEYIIPLLKNKNFKICDINTPQQGYLDLYLLSRCRIIVASHGNMGAYAKILAPHNPLLITARDQNIFSQLENTMLINWGESTQMVCPSNITPPPPAKLNIRNRMRLGLYRYLRNKLVHKGIL